MNKLICLLLLIFCMFNLLGQEESHAKLDLRVMHAWVVNDDTIDVEIEFHNAGDDFISYKNLYTASGVSLLKFLFIMENGDVYCAQRKKVGWWTNQGRFRVLKPGEKIRRMCSITPQTWELPEHFNTAQIAELACCFILPAGYAHKEGRSVSSHASAHISDMYSMVNPQNTQKESDACLNEELLWQLCLLANLVSESNGDTNELQNLTRQTLCVLKRIQRWEQNDEVIFYKKHILKMLSKVKKGVSQNGENVVMNRLKEVVNQIPD